MDPARAEASRMEVTRVGPQPPTLEYLVAFLRRRSGIQLPASNDDWTAFPRTRITVRRDKVLADALKEVKKASFDPAKLMDVSTSTTTIWQLWTK